jgi:hypothetical protein
MDTSEVLCDDDGFVIDENIDFSDDEEIELVNRSTLPEPSLEQLNIIDSMINNHMIIDSVAGCGKTTTSFI